MITRRLLSGKPMPQWALGVAAAVLSCCTAYASGWDNKPVSGQTYSIVNEQSGLNLEVEGWSKQDGGNIDQSPSSCQANQQWKVTQLSDGSWSILSAYNQKSLDNFGWSKRSGDPVRQWAYKNTPNQHWTLQATGSGAFKIISSFSQQLLSINDNNASSTVTHNNDVWWPHQHWYLIPTAENCAPPSNASRAFSKTFMGSKKILIGGSFDDSTAGQAPFDARYVYLHSQPAKSAACYANCYTYCNATPWWGCWGTWQQSASGVYVTRTDDTDAKATWQGKAHPQIPLWTWYSLRDLGDAAGQGDGPGEVQAIQNAALLSRYLSDYRFFLEKIGNNRAMVHLEPDFWGYVQSINVNPHKVAAKVREADPADCGTQEDSAAGLAQCLVSMAHTYARNATVGLHVSCWNYRQPGAAKICAQFYSALGAGKEDFLVTDASDRDAGWYEKHNNPGQYWDDQSFATWLDSVKTITEGVGKPMVIWQIPLGNMEQNNTKDHYQDNKVDYLFTHINEVADAHVAALMFGAGWGEQTTPETDGGNLINKTINYWKSGGTPLR